MFTCEKCGGSPIKCSLSEIRGPDPEINLTHQTIVPILTQPGYQLTPWFLQLCLLYHCHAPEGEFDKMGWVDKLYFGRIVRCVRNSVLQRSSTTCQARKKKRQQREKDKKYASGSK
eukprot:403351-Pelagomonas_calceolata.AAC.1